MHKVIITEITKNIKISWHPMTKSLHKYFMQSYDAEFQGRIVEIFKDKPEYNLQTIFLTSEYESVKLLNQMSKTKRNKARQSLDYKIIAGCFNPWFDKDTLKDSKQLVAIELRPTEDQDEKYFEEELQKLILLDFIKSISQANMSLLGNNFFGLKDITTCSSSLKHLYTELMGHKLSAKQYADYFGHQRDFVYKHRQE